MTKQEPEIRKLSEYSHMRLRTEMYLGSRDPHTQVVINWNGTKLVADESTWTPAVYCAFREILDNSLDEVLGHHHGDKIDVEFDPKTITFGIRDNGRGIPIDWDEHERMHKATLALSHARAGRNFDEREEVRGTNGIGASTVVNCSEWVKVDIVRDGQRFRQSFREGGEFFDGLQIDEPVIGKSSGKSGTYIQFKLSPRVFSNIILKEEFVKSRIFEVAANHPDVKFTFNGEKVAVKHTTEKTLFDGLKIVKIPVVCEYVDRGRKSPPYFINFNSMFYLVPGFAETGEYAHSTVNDIPAFNGGQHIDAFRRRFYAGMISALSRESNRRGLKPNANDISDGLLIYNVTRMHAPNFDSQSKTRLINEDVDTVIKSALEDVNLYKNIVRTNKDWVEAIFEHCAARTQKKDTSDVEKNNRRLLRTKVPKLLDATGKDRSKCILLLTEGDSAKSSVGAVRDPEIHGALPLRGKIINANGETSKTLQDNAIIADIMSAIGLALGRTAKRDNLRYGSVYLAADQDPDGANITALLVNFFYLNWPELFDPKQDPFFYAFMTPFIIQQKGKERHYWYADDYLTYDANDWKNCPHPTRAKGLGSLEKVDWIHSLKSPRLIGLHDDGKLNEALDLIFSGKRADDRKVWISLNG